MASRKLIFSLYSIDVTNTVSFNACSLWRTVEIEGWAEKLYKNAFVRRSRKTWSIYLNMNETGKCLDHNMPAKVLTSQSSRERLEKGEGLGSKARDIQVDKKVWFCKAEVTWLVEWPTMKAVYSPFLGISDQDSDLRYQYNLTRQRICMTSCRGECSLSRMKSKFLVIKEAEKDGVNQIKSTFTTFMLLVPLSEHQEMYTGKVYMI